MASTLRMSRILWGALLWSCVLYAIVAFVARPADAVPQPILLPLLSVAAVVVAVLSFVIPRITYASAARSMTNKPAIVERGAMPVDAAHFRSSGTSGPVFADAPAAEAAARKLYQTTLILGIALSEAVALFGIVLAFTGFGPVVFLPFVAAGAVLIAIRFPTRDAVVSPFEKVFGAKLEDVPPG